MTAPCKNCIERHHKCHADCERYKEWKEPYEKARKQKDIDHKIDETILVSKEKVIRRKNK